MIKEIATQFKIDSKAVKTMFESYKEEETSDQLNFKEFVGFLRLEESTLLKHTYEAISGSNGFAETKLVLLYFMNVSPLSKDDKLKFAFNLFDEEESRIITYKELLKIL